MVRGVIGDGVFDGSNELAVLENLVFLLVRSVKGTKRRSLFHSFPSSFFSFFFRLFDRSTDYSIDKKLI